MCAMGSHSSWTCSMEKSSKVSFSNWQYSNRLSHHLHRFGDSLQSQGTTRLYEMDSYFYSHYNSSLNFNWISSPDALWRLGKMESSVFQILLSFDSHFLCFILLLLFGHWLYLHSRSISKLRRQDQGILYFILFHQFCLQFRIVWKNHRFRWNWFCKVQLHLDQPTNGRWTGDRQRK